MIEKIEQSTANRIKLVTDLLNPQNFNRTQKELEEFLSHDFFPRFGAGIGLTRLSRAYEMLK